MDSICIKLDGNTSTAFEITFAGLELEERGNVYAKGTDTDR